MNRDFNPNHIHKKEYFKVGVKVCIFNTNNKLLLLQRSQKSGNGGSWSLPGGALEFGEDLYKAAEREIEEETLLKVKELEIYTAITHSNPKNALVIVGFVCKHVSGKVDLNWEHDDYKWVSTKEALKYNLSPDAKNLIASLK